MEPIVDLREIEKSYTVGGEQLHVLKKVSLFANQGEYIAILGASGSGKSTLMNIIGCMDTPDTGSYFLAGTDVCRCSDRELTVLRNEKIGFIFQKYHLIPQYTILQNVILPLLVQGKGRDEATQIAEKFIRMVGLWERIGHKPNELSGGQQQRVAIARALAPLSVLPEYQYNCLCLCSGSLGANPENNVADIIRTYCDRIAFAHIRNVRHYPNGDFTEASHRDCDGDTGILDIMKAYHDCGYAGYVRPDHGRHIWGEQCRPGYGLYDRALGIMYLWGCWDMLEKTEGKIGE